MSDCHDKEFLSMNMISGCSWYECHCDDDDDNEEDEATRIVTIRSIDIALIAYFLPNDFQTLRFHLEIL